MKSVPKIYKNGARQLLDKMKEHRDVLDWNDKGELVYENKPIPGSHVVVWAMICCVTVKGLNPWDGRCLRGDWPE